MFFPPLIWTVLLFGIFIPFVVAGFKNIKNSDNFSQKVMILLFSSVGVLYSPILTWIGAVIFETMRHKL